MMVYDDKRAGRSIRADDDLLVLPADGDWEVVRSRGPQGDQTVLRTFTGPHAEAAARQYQQQLMVRSR